MRAVLVGISFLLADPNSIATSPAGRNRCSSGRAESFFWVRDPRANRVSKRMPRSLVAKLIMLDGWSMKTASSGKRFRGITERRHSKRTIALRRLPQSVAIGRSRAGSGLRSLAGRSKQHQLSQFPRALSCRVRSGAEVRETLESAQRTTDSPPFSRVKGGSWRQPQSERARSHTHAAEQRSGPPTGCHRVAAGC